MDKLDSSNYVIMERDNTTSGFVTLPYLFEKDPLDPDHLIRTNITIEEASSLGIDLSKVERRG